MCRVFLSFVFYTVFYHVLFIHPNTVFIFTCLFFCLFLFVSFFVYSSIYLFICSLFLLLFIFPHLFIHLFIIHFSLYIHSSLFFYSCTYIHIFTHQSIYRFLHLFTQPFIRISRTCLLRGRPLPAGAEPSSARVEDRLTPADASPILQVLPE